MDEGYKLCNGLHISAEDDREYRTLTLPNKMQVLLVDPMLATGGSCKMAIQSLVDAGVAAANITFLNVIACPEGLASLAAAYPEVKVITACVDEGMNEHKYIVPGLGDYGDRFFNTV